MSTTPENPSILKEVSSEGQAFETDFEHFRQAGCDPDLIVALYPMITSSNPAEHMAAGKFLMAHRSQPAAIDTTEDARQRHMLIQEARQVTLRAGHKPTPDAIRHEYAPSDAALNSRLDAVGAGKSYNDSNLKPLGQSRHGEAVRPDAQHRSLGQYGREQDHLQARRGRDLSGAHAKRHRRVMPPCRTRSAQTPSPTGPLPQGGCRSMVAAHG